MKARNLFDLVKVTWVDAHNNQGAWMTADELADFAKDEAYRVTQVGYKVHEDDQCIVLAARLSTPSPEYGQSFGMCERIPRKLIDSETILALAGDIEQTRDLVGDGEHGPRMPAALHNAIGAALTELFETLGLPKPWFSQRLAFVAAVWRKFHEDRPSFEGVPSLHAAFRGGRLSTDPNMAR